MKPHIIVLSLFFIGCTKMCTQTRESMSPKDVVEAYLRTAFNIQELKQKELILQYVTGDLKNAISGASDDTIMEAYVKPRYVLKNMYIIEQDNKTPRETEVSYQLQYQENPENQKISEASTITTENRVSLIKENGRWYIQGVISKETSIEFPLLKISVIKPDSTQ